MRLAGTSSLMSSLAPVLAEPADPSLAEVPLDQFLGEVMSDPARRQPSPSTFSEPLASLSHSRAHVLVLKPFELDGLLGGAPVCDVRSKQLVESDHVGSGSPQKDRQT